jgi:hypothetical protein
MVYSKFFRIIEESKKRKREPPEPADYKYLEKKI